MRRTHESSEGSLAPDETPTPPVAPDVGVISSEGWKPMDDEALSGSAIVVRSKNGETAEVYLRPTRYYDMAKMGWAQTTKWALRNASGSYLWFEPVEYMPIA